MIKTIIVATVHYRAYHLGVENASHQDTSVAAAVPAPNNSVRAELIGIAFGSGVPNLEIHERFGAWASGAALNTLCAMRSDLRIADEFQRRGGRATIPMAPRDLYALLEERARLGKAKASIDRLVASLVRIHDLAKLPPCVDEMVRWKQREIRKSSTRLVAQARGLRLKGDTLNVIEDEPHPVSLLGLLDSIGNDPAGLRDKALLSAAYDAGLRRSEVVRMLVQHIERQPNGEASLFIPRSKTDQAGEGARVWLSARSVAHIDSWLEASEITEGFVFRSLSYRTGRDGHLAEGACARIIKLRLEKHLRSLHDGGSISHSEIAQIVSATSSHSLRVGCDQDLFAAGLDIGAIMQGLRWTSPKQPLAYARHLAPGTSKLAGLLRSAEPRR